MAAHLSIIHLCRVRSLLPFELLGDPARLMTSVVYIRVLFYLKLKRFPIAIHRILFIEALPIFFFFGAYIMAVWIGAQKFSFSLDLLKS